LFSLFSRLVDHCADRVICVGDGVNSVDHFPTGSDYARAGVSRAFDAYRYVELFWFTGGRAVSLAALN
jgi:hypothetical protein